MILLLGGSGLLGKELQKHLNLIAPSHKELDITKPIYVLDYPGFPEVNLIVHCAAYTDVARAEEEKEQCYLTNVIGTRNVASLGVPMIYISTEYVFDGEKGNYSEEDYPNPRNFYALTKLLGEYESRRTRSLVIRCLFKPDPFEHIGACVDQYTSGGYVKDIAKEIKTAIIHYEEIPETIHIGLEKRSTYEIAKITRPDVIPITRESIAVRIPRDTSLNTNKWRAFKNERGLC